MNWTIELVDGQYEVHRGSRRKRTWSDLDAALRWLKSKVKNGEKVYLVEEDGYRINITRKHFPQ